MWSNKKGAESIGFFGSSVFRRVLGPLFLTCATPVFTIFLWYVCCHLNGSFFAFFELIRQRGLIGGFYSIWPSPSWVALKMIVIYGGFQLLLLLLPGKKFTGPVTPAGHVPVYTDNGLYAYFISMFTYYVASEVLNIFHGGIAYDHLGELLATTNILGIAFCLFLYFKGIYFPSGLDHGSSGSPVLDFFWGTELYPRIGPWDVKQFTNCRFGMVSWPILLLSYALKQKELYGFISNSMLISVTLQLIYVTKFFIWESGYMSSFDIMHDRAGFYLCWGCLNWLPCIYTSHSMYLVQHPNQLGTFAAVVCFGLGVLSIIINYDADRQRQHFRLAEGKTTVWGKKPKYIVAKFKTERGHEKSSLLLMSGYWGLSRHFHYLPEVLASFFWTAPALFDAPAPYFYVIYLALLLTDRAYRDDARCSHKYGKYWTQYCKEVPHRIVPLLF